MVIGALRLLESKHYNLSGHIGHPKENVEIVEFLKKSVLTFLTP